MTLILWGICKHDHLYSYLFFLLPLISYLEGKLVAHQVFFEQINPVRIFILTANKSHPATKYYTYQKIALLEFPKILTTKHFAFSFNRKYLPKSSRARDDSCRNILAIIAFRKTFKIIFNWISTITFWLSLTFYGRKRISLAAWMILSWEI